MSKNGNDLVVAGLFTSLIAAAATIGWQVTERYGWRLALIFAIGCAWLLGMVGLVVNDAIDHYLARRNRRKPKQ